MISYKKYKLLIKESYKDAKRIWSDDSKPDEIDELINRYKFLKDRNQLKGDKKGDIGYWMDKTFNEFKQFVIQKEKEYDKKVPLKIKAKDEDAPIVFENSEVVVRKILSHEASCKWGNRAEWCISKPSSAFEGYDQQQRVQFYFIFPKDNLKDELFNYDISRVSVGVHSRGELEVNDNQNEFIDEEQFREINHYYFDIPETIFKGKKGFRDEYEENGFSIDLLERAEEQFNEYFKHNELRLDNRLKAIKIHKYDNLESLYTDYGVHTQKYLVFDLFNNEFEIDETHVRMFVSKHNLPEEVYLDVKAAMEVQVYNNIKKLTPITYGKKSYLQLYSGFGTYYLGMTIDDFFIRFIDNISNIAERYYSDLGEMMKFQIPEKELYKFDEEQILQDINQKD